MSHIVSFKIEGLAGRKDPIELKLNRDTNIFFGLNGSGKTTLLKILHSAMANETDLLVGVPFVAAEVEIYSIEHKKSFTRTIRNTEMVNLPPPYGKRRYRLVTETGGGVIQSVASGQDWAWSCSDASKEVHAARWAHTYLPTSRLHVCDEPISYGEHYVAGQLTERQLDAVFARSVELLWNRYSANVLSSVRRAQEQGLVSILRTVLSSENKRGKRRRGALTITTAFARVQSFLKRQGSTAILGDLEHFGARYAADPTLQDVVQDIDQVEDQIAIAMQSRNSLEELICRMFQDNKTIRFTDQSIEVHALSGNPIGLAALSSGEKHLIRIFVESLLVGGSSLMVDEPELSMHVDWQKDLISSMRLLNAEAQFIFATHSPEIMADVEDNRIFRI